MLLRKIRLRSSLVRAGELAAPLAILLRKKALRVSRGTEKETCLTTAEDFGAEQERGIRTADLSREGLIEMRASGRKRLEKSFGRMRIHGNNADIMARGDSPLKISAGGLSNKKELQFNSCRVSLSKKYPPEMYARPVRRAPNISSLLGRRGLRVGAGYALLQRPGDPGGPRVTAAEGARGRA